MMTIDPLPQHGSLIGRRVGKAVTAAQRELRWQVRRSRAQAPPAGISGWIDRFEKQLTDGILPFWIEYGVDRTNGGMFGWLGARGEPIPPGTKSIVPHARILWLFSAAFARFGGVAYREVADHCLDLIRHGFHDARHGGFYWLLDDRGRLIDDRKHLYGQSSVLLALIEYGRAFDDRSTLDEAVALFEVIDDRSHDEVNGGYTEVLSGDWTLRLDGDRFFGPPAERNQCAQLRLLESLRALYEVTGEDRVAKRLDEMAFTILGKMIDLEKGYCYPRTDARWSPLPPRLVSYGHDIELVWLLRDALAVLRRSDDPLLDRAVRRMAENTLERGFDSRSGGVYWEGIPGGSPTNRAKVRWPQAEALIGFLDAFGHTGDLTYLDAFDRQARYVWTRMIDHTVGEWFDGDGMLRRALGPKASIWSDPYHQGRACLEIGPRWAAYGGAGR